MGQPLLNTLIVVSILLFGHNSLAQVGLTDGKGSNSETITTTNPPPVQAQLYTGTGTANLSVSGTNQVINSYTEIITPLVPAGTSTVIVGNASYFNPGREILVYQVQHDSNHGVYEYAFIQSVNTSTDSITLTQPLLNSYFSGQFDSQPASAAQIISVPHFRTVTIQDGASLTAPAWNGRTGGILTYRVAGELNLMNSGKLDVSEKGFRGGDYGAGNNYPGHEGEGILGLGVASTTTFPYIQYPTDINNGGAGGPGNSHCGGGGGGGGHARQGFYGMPGSTYGDIAYGGYAVGTAEMERIYFGGGGGGGSDDDSYSSGDLARGGEGGGIIMIHAEKISGGSFISNGESKADRYSCGAAEGSGGAGGSIDIRTHSIDNSSFSIQGGKGENVEGPNGHGGNGSNGRLRLSYTRDHSSLLTLPDISGDNGTIYIEEIPNIPGDVDGNGVLDLTDVILSLKIISGPPPVSKIYIETDVNGDGAIGLEEGIFVLQKISE